MAIRTNHFFSSQISSINGVVSNLSNELLEYVNHEKPTHDHSSVYYKRFYVSKFNVGDQALEAVFSSPMKIQDGDMVTVSGQQKNKVFKVLAYQNQTQNITHHENWIALILGAIFFFVIDIALLNSELAIEGALAPKLFLFGFSLVGIYMGYRALLIREATRLISTK